LLLRLNGVSLLKLQLDRFDFSDESLVVVGEERTDHVEHGVTEATDVQRGSKAKSRSGAKGASHF
jgi:hypothetical protein